MKIKLSEKTLRSLARVINEALDDQLIAQGFKLTRTEKDKEVVISIYQEEWDLDEVVFGSEDNPRFVLEIEGYTIINEHGATRTKSILSTGSRREIRSSAFDGKNGCNQ